MNTILSVFTAGTLTLIGLFALCFFIVHIARLSRIGWNAQKHAPPSSSETEKQTPKEEPLQEPVYYIVEKKRRAKTSYGAPKQIRFK